MNCGGDKNPTYHSFIHLGANVLFLALEHLRHSEVVEETIHVKFNDTELDKDLSELDKSFANLRLDDCIKDKVSSNQIPKVEAST